MPALRLFAALLGLGAGAVVALSPAPAAVRPIHVDCSAAASDRPDGSPARPYRTLAEINARPLAPGDRVLFRRGTTCGGVFAPTGSGAAAAPITVDAYGGGAAAARIAGGGLPDAVRLHNQSFWEIRNLEITNSGTGTARRRGVRVSAADSGLVRHIVLENLSVHDVNGDDSKNVNGSAGITLWVEGTATPTRFDDVRILDNRITKVDRSGVFLFSTWNRYGWGDGTTDHRPWTRVTVSGNTVTDVGGDGIVLGSTRAGLAERNRVHGYQRRSPGYNAGIWTHNSDDTVIQRNEVSGGETTRDGMAFDADQGAYGALFQYNYSHDNTGGFLLLCNADGAVRRIVVRYNVSQNDRHRGVRTCAGAVESAHVYNNTIYVGPGVTQNVIDENGGGPHHVRFENNVVVKEGEGAAAFALRPDGAVRLATNVLHGAGTAPPNPGGSTADPRLTAAGAGLDGYRLRASSPVLGAGNVIADNGGRDLYGNPVPATARPNPGAYEGPGETNGP